MFSVFRKVLHGLGTAGPAYLFRVVPNELARPRLALTRRLRGLLIAIGDRSGRKPTANDAWEKDCLQFFYDFAAASITFDFASYLAAAEIERRRRGLRSLVVIFVPGSHDGLRRELPAYEAAMDTSARAWRLRHILFPMLALLPSVRGYAVCGTRAEAQALIADDPARIYPSDYRVFLPRQPPPADIHDQARLGVSIWPMFRATRQGRRLADAFLKHRAKGRRAVVITLRNSQVSPERNSRHADWLAFADSLDPRIFAPVFVEDTDRAEYGLLEEFSGHIVCEAAAWNLELRMGLYEAAWLNAAIMHGPLELCWYNEQARYLLFVPVGTTRVTSPEFLIESGLDIGTDLTFAKPYQRLVWGPDVASSIFREFDTMLPLLEAQEDDAVTQRMAEKR